MGGGVSYRQSVTARSDRQSKDLSLLRVYRSAPSSNCVPSPGASSGMNPAPSQPAKGGVCSSVACWIWEWLIPPVPAAADSDQSEGAYRRVRAAPIRRESAVLVAGQTGQSEEIPSPKVGVVMSLIKPLSGLIAVARAIATRAWTSSVDREDELLFAQPHAGSSAVLFDELNSGFFQSS